MHAAPDITMREPAMVMSLDRLGLLHQSRLSFMRILTRRIAQDGWTFSRPAFEIDATGVGHALYSAHTPERVYTLVAFSHDLPDEQRSDRVIAEAWDVTLCLFDGVPDAGELADLRENVPLQEAGRVSQKVLSLSRANRSTRLWAHVVDALATNRQPDPVVLSDVGYLMRTTAVYGSGKFGAADRCLTCTRREFRAPFQIEMLSVYLTRLFVRDLVQHMADCRASGKAAQLDPALARGLGIGNSTGLGMAPFIVNHPDLLNNWIVARETALLRVRRQREANVARTALFRSLLKRSLHAAYKWQSEHPIQTERLSALRADLERLYEHANAVSLQDDYPWNRLYSWAEAELSVDAQECLVSLLIEPYGDLVDDLADTMAAGCQGFPIDGSMSIATLHDSIKAIYGWAEGIDWSALHNTARAWYVSAEKLEPRLGHRYDEPISGYEQPLAPVRDVSQLRMTAEQMDGAKTVADLLHLHPEHRLAVRRVQQAMAYPYGELHDNTVNESFLPIDMLRCKLAFFGAQSFDPRSDRWVRISMFAGAPYPEDLSAENCQFWPYPEFGR